MRTQQTYRVATSMQTEYGIYKNQEEDLDTVARLARQLLRLHDLDVFVNRFTENVYDAKFDHYVFTEKARDIFKRAYPGCNLFFPEALVKQGDEDGLGWNLEDHLPLALNHMLQKYLFLSPGKVIFALYEEAVAKKRDLFLIMNDAGTDTPISDHCVMFARRLVFPLSYHLMRFRSVRNEEAIKLWFHVARAQGAGLAAHARTIQWILEKEQGLTPMGREEVSSYLDDLVHFGDRFLALEDCPPFMKPYPLDEILAQVGRDLRYTRYASPLHISEPPWQAQPKLRVPRQTARFVLGTMTLRALATNQQDNANSPLSLEPYSQGVLLKNGRWEGNPFRWEALLEECAGLADPEWRNLFTATHIFQKAMNGEPRVDGDSIELRWDIG